MLPSLPSPPPPLHSPLLPHHICQAVVAKSVDLGPLSVLLVSLVMISESDTGSSTAQLCEGGGGREGEG